MSAPEKFSKMRFVPPPSIVIVWPVPSISTVCWIEGSPLASAIVPLTLKAIVSLPVPAAQSPPVVSAFALALLIASRRPHRWSPVDTRIKQRVDGDRVGAAGVERMADREDD